MRGRWIFAGSAAVVLVVMMTLSPMPVRAAEAEEISLPEAVRRLERVNPSIQSAVWREKAAERGVWEARSGFLPSVSLSGDFTRTEEPNLVTPMREEPSPMSDSELEFEEQIYTGVARVEVPIVNLPAIGRAETARKSARLETAERDALEQRLIAAVMEVYVQARQIDDSLSLMDASIAALKRRREELIDLREEGRVPRSEVTELESRLDARRADRLQLTGRQEELSYRLAELLDLD
ncbi:MAG: TolC family protein, partial [Spirochaetaceae bacterium]